MVVPLSFAPGTQPQVALVTDSFGVTGITGLLVLGNTYVISIEFGDYNSIFPGAVVVPDLDK